MKKSNRKNKEFFVLNIILCFLLFGCKEYEENKKLGKSELFSESGSGSSVSLLPSLDAKCGSGSCIKN
jgi:hypothetical protein